MENFKNKLYNYEAQPPEHLWDNIAKETQNKKVIKMPLHSRSKLFFYSATAAASIVVILFASLFIKHQRQNNFQSVQQENSTLLAKKIKDSIQLNQKILESIIQNPKEKEEIISEKKLKNLGKKYLTVAGPEGQPVKISPKVATLIVYADKEFPPRPIWSNKICKWQEIMLSSTISPTSANLVDLIQVAANSDHLE